ncbi:MAG: hypothetical protein AAB289_13140 [Chloroflexota bacterium]
MALRFGPIRLPWASANDADDPFWERFLYRPLHDPDNAFGETLRRLPEGAVFPQKGEVHSPEVMSAHIKELARFLGAPLCGVVRVSDGGTAGPPDAGVGIVCGLPTEYHPSRVSGMAGQAPVLQGGFVTYILAAYIRELGYPAFHGGDLHSPALAALAGLGAADAGGRPVYWADVVRTSLPLAADCNEVFEWPPTS